MHRPIQYTATPRNTQWIDLSDQHKSVRERLQSSLTSFAQGEGAPVPSIVGAYGSGKSELMAWGFRHCWCTLGIPAFVLNAENLLKQLPATMSPTQFSHEVGGYVRNQLALLGDLLEDNDPEGLHLATDKRAGESALTYLRELFDELTLSSEAIRAMLQAGRGVLFIDEIEQQYSELLDRVEANDRAPLREMLQRLGNGQEDYYVVLSFGLTSAYEAIGGADARRMDTLTLPIPEPAELAKFANLDGYGNFIWWTSRGRPGWAAKLANDWGSSIDEVQALERLADLQPSSIENLPLIDVSNLHDALRSQRTSELITQLLKWLQPLAWSDLQFSVERDERDVLPRNLILIVGSQDELIPLADLVDCLMHDLVNLAKRLEMPVSDQAQLRRYLMRVCTAMADSKGRIAFGGPRKAELLAKGVIAPLLILTQDLILEFEGNRQSTLGVLSFLDKVMNHIGIVGDQVKDEYDLVREFPRAQDRFIEARGLNQDSWIALAPKAIEALFPRLVGRPLLTLLPNTKPTLDEQRAALEAAVQNEGLRLTATVPYEGTIVEFVFVPTASCLRTIEAADFNRNRRRRYLAANKVFVLVDLADEDGVHLLRELYGDDVNVLEDLEKLQNAALPEKRLRDFLASLWHNLLQVDFNDEATISLEDALERIRSEADLTKSDRRKLDYYQQRLVQTLESLAIASTRAYRRRLRRLFIPGEPGFPGKRIEDALSGVRESRSIEQIGLALDLVTEYEATVEGLVGLRGLDNLRRMTRPPNAYHEFLQTYSVTTTPVKEPGASLRELYEYIRTQDRFDGLLDVAARLGLQPPMHFESASDATASAPLLYLYGNLALPEQILIKAISLHAYVESNRSEYQQLLNELADDIAQIQSRLADLQRAIEDFNKELDYDLLAWAEVETYQREASELLDILAARTHFPPMLTYVIYRFVDSVTAALRDQGQRWASEHGLEGWRLKLRELRNWRDDLAGIQEEIDSLFAENCTLKTDILGSPEAILSEISRLHEQGAGQVFDSLQTGNDPASSDRYRVNTQPYVEAHIQTREHLNGLRDQTDAIDQLLAETDEILSTVNRAIDRLGESHDE